MKKAIHQKKINIFPQIYYYYLQVKIKVYLLLKPKDLMEKQILNKNKFKTFAWLRSNIFSLPNINPSKVIKIKGVNPRKIEYIRL